MKIAVLTTDNRENDRRYDLTRPYFGAAPEALLQGLATMSDLEVHVLSCTQRPLRSPQKLAANVWFHSLHVPKSGWLRTGYQGCIRAIRRKVRELKPDVVHGEGTERDCAISAVFSGFPAVVTIHGNMAQLAHMFRAPVGSYRWWAARLENLTLSQTLGVFCNSDYTEQLVRPRARRTWRVPNAIRQEFFAPPQNIPSTFPILCCVGGIVGRKRPLELAQLAETLSQEGHRFELRFIGRLQADDRYAIAFRSQIKVSSVSLYLGERSTADLLRELDSAHALVHFPSEEAFGLVAAEALARNLKLFASKVGGIPDITHDVESAELFQADDFDSLKAAIARWLTAGAPRPTLAAAAMLRYKPEKIAARHVEIYREVLNTSS